MHFRLLEVSAILIVALGGAIEYANIRVIDRARLHYQTVYLPVERDYEQHMRVWRASETTTPNTSYQSDGVILVKPNLSSRDGAQSQYAHLTKVNDALALQRRLVSEISETRRLADSLSPQHRKRLVAFEYDLRTTSEGVRRDQDALVPHANGEPLGGPIKLEGAGGWVPALQDFSDRVRAEARWLLRDIEAQRSRWSRVFFAALMMGTVLMATSKLLNWARESDMLQR